VSGLPLLIGLDGGRTPADAPVFGFSYTSDDGGTTWVKSTTFSFRFSLVLAALPAPGS